MLSEPPRSGGAWGHRRVSQPKSLSALLKIALRAKAVSMRPAGPQTMHRVIARAMNVAHRLAHGLPSPARARLRSVVAWRDRRYPAPPIEDWSRPLIAALDRPDASRNRLIRATETFAGSNVVQPARSYASAEPGGAGPAELRCLLVTCVFDIGGLAEVVAFLARRLTAYGLRTAVLHARSDPSATGEPSGRLGRMLRSNDIEVREADEGGTAAWIERWRPDVISAHHAPAWVLPIAGRLGVPYVDNLHGMHDLFGTDTQAESARGAKLAAVVAVSELVRQQYLAANRGFPPGRIATIPNAIDDERHPGDDRAAARSWLGLGEEYLFVSLARLCLQKNPYGLLSAFGELARHRPEAHLVLAGSIEPPDDSRYYRQVLRLRDSLPCRDRIHLRSHLAAPFGLLAAADGFVLDSFFEGWCLASMEALFAGVPVVLSDVGGAREQIGDDPARGYLVGNPLGDPLRVDWDSIGRARYRPQVNHAELVTAMEQLVANRQGYLRGRKRLAAESAARFSAAVCLARHGAVLRAVAAGAGFRSTDDTRRVYPSADGTASATDGVVVDPILPRLPIPGDFDVHTTPQ
jgi:glycosyltransferase involved in cell wall biosynthesis